MKAWILHNIDDIRFEDTPEPEQAPGEVVVEVKAAGICGSDIPRIFREGAHNMPLIPGHEFSGQVVEAAGENAHWLNKRVGIFPLIPCRKCIACRKGAYEMCRSYSYLGSRRDGGFAEKVAVPVDNLIELPDNVSFAEAAMLEPMAVAVHAMRRVDIKEDDNVVICGLGTIGVFLTMFIKERGIKNVFVIGNKDFQKVKVSELGISSDYFCDMRVENVSEWIMQKTGGCGADIFFECVGRNETVSQAVKLTAPGGSVCMVGNPYSDMELDKNTYWKLLRNQLKVTGTWNSGFFDGDAAVCDDTDWKYVVNLLKNKKISPEKFISHRFSLEKLDRGMAVMRDKSEDYLKCMFLAE